MSQLGSCYSAFSSAATADERELAVRNLGDVFEFGEWDDGEGCEVLQQLVAAAEREDDVDVLLPLVVTIGYAFTSHETPPRLDLRPLVGRLATAPPEVAERIVTVLGLSGDARYSAAIKACLSSPHADVAESAADALEMLSGA